MDRTVKVVGDEQFAKPPLIAEHGLTVRRPGPQQAVGEAVLDLLVGLARAILSHGSKKPGTSAGQVSAA